MEGELLKLLRQNKEAGGSASLTFFTTRDGKLKAKLEVELDPSAPTSPGSTSPLPATAPAPGGGRRRRKGASAKAKAKARAALHRATQAAATLSPPASGDASAPLEAPAQHQQYHPPLRHPPHLLLSPSPSSGRRRIMSVGRLPMPSFGSLNLDGPPPSPPSYPPPPPPPPSPPPSSRPLARTALRVRSVNLRDSGGSDVGLANLAKQFHVNNYRRRWVSLSRSIDSDLSSSCSSASSLSPSGSVSDHFDCPDLVLGSEGGWETDSDVG